MEVSAIRGTVLGSSFYKNPAIWGSILGVPYFREPPTWLRAAAELGKPRNHIIT